MTTTKNKVENPVAEFSGIDSNGNGPSRLCVSFTKDGAFFHVWLDPKTRELEKGGIYPNTLFKNPPVGVNQHDPGYFRTKHLDATAKGNAELIHAVIKRCDFKAARAAFDKKERAEKAARDKDNAAHAAAQRLAAAAPLAHQILAAIGTWMDAGSDDIDLETPMPAPCAGTIGDAISEYLAAAGDQPAGK